MREYYIQLHEFDLGQVLDGLEMRAVSWEKTAIYHRTGESPHDMVIEECRDAKEADKIAAHYHSIIAKIRKQREAQS
jgi:hypothetical protein